jgi:hypothetical protein
MTPSCRILVVLTLALGSFVAGNASTISLGSYATTASNPGFDNTATSYMPGSSTVNNGSAATYDISSGTVWHAPLGASSYVSYNAGTGAALSTVAPNGDYFYSSIFTLPSKTSGGPYVGTLSVLADDTLAVYLNGTQILAAAGPMGPGNSYSHCSDSGPNCVTPFTFSFGGILDGENVLTFDVKQVNGYNEGLDYAGLVTSVPEPSSLAMFGTGMFGVVGLMRRFGFKK